MAGILRDVSDEVALEQSRAIAASVFNDAGEAIVITDERGAVLDANAAMLQMSGYTRDELIGRANLPWRPADRLAPAAPRLAAGRPLAGRGLVAAPRRHRIPSGGGDFGRARRPRTNHPLCRRRAG
ncbi:MAG: PAS domain S-box protein, partial [Tepidimonas sp.]